MRLQPVALPGYLLPSACPHASTALPPSAFYLVFQSESLLREYCDFSKEERCIGDAMIGAQLPLGLLSEGVAACAVTRRCAARLVLG